MSGCPPAHSISSIPLGAALGAIAVGFFLFYWFDVRQTIAIAAAMNLTASAIVASALVRK
jgi:hypothetical protein